MYPIHTRRKHFFDARQKEGQSAVKFSEELLSLLEEADGANITCNDLMCMMLQIGLTDNNMQRELGGIGNPTLDAFSEKIEGYEQAKRTMATSAHGLAVSRGNASVGRRNNNASNKSPNKAQSNRSRVERDRRLALRGKCFRCARADHMLPQCTYPETVKCNLCGAAGHVTPACSPRQSAQAMQHQQISSFSHASSSPSGLTSHQLAIAYDGESQVTHDGPSASWPLPSSASSSVSSHNNCAGAYYTPANMPTPEMPL